MTLAGQVQRNAAPIAPACHQGQRSRHMQPSAAFSPSPFVKHHAKQRALAVGATRPTRRPAGILVVAKAVGDVLVTGAAGQTAARIALQLARSGYEVTAGVDDVEAAQDVIGIAKKLELLLPSEAAAVKAAECNLADSESLVAALPRKAGRVVLVAGDTINGRRVDPKPLQRALATLAENSGRVAQVVLVTPLGGPTGTGIFGLGAKPRPGVLSKLEEQVVESGLNYLIVRTATTDRVPDSYGSEASPVVASLGGLPDGLSVSRFQVARAVAEAMSQTQGMSAIVEVGADPAADSLPVADQLSQVLAAAAGAAAAQRRQQVDESSDEEEAPSNGSVFGSILKTVSSRGGSKKQQVEVVEPEPAPATAKKPAFSFRLGKQKEVEVEEEEEEAPAAPAKRAPLSAPRRGIFGSQRQAVAEVEEEVVVVEAPRPARIIRGRKPLAAVEEVEKPARAAPAKRQEQAEEGSQKKKGGALQWLGIGQETVYADE